MDVAARAEIKERAIQYPAAPPSPCPVPPLKLDQISSPPPNTDIQPRIKTPPSARKTGPAHPGELLENRGRERRSPRMRGRSYGYSGSSTPSSSTSGTPLVGNSPVERTVLRDRPRSMREQYSGGSTTKLNSPASSVIGSERGGGGSERSYRGGEISLPRTPRNCAVAAPVQIEFVIIGCSGVGKTSLLQRFTRDTFSELTAPTVQVDLARKNMEIDDCTVRLIIKDTAGQEKFHSMAPHYYRTAHGAILTYDTTLRSSLEGLKFFIDNLRKYGRMGVQTILVGNKIDQCATSRRNCVTPAEAEAFAKMHGIEWFFETSALTGYGVNESFMHLAEYVYRKMEAERKIQEALSARGATHCGPTRVVRLIEDDPHTPALGAVRSPPGSPNDSKGCC
eukprot:TRINITY_DN68046_c8_g4_i1.p1 TRINITY_DN68046_c8_g4~~TRINITY_DN68046_c8_g4_i1.p1  ORF type:complete len:394 (-),score=7.64 TRINITY_DN68046_c8_g4_i1:1244-2425(-)